MPQIETWRAPDGTAVTIRAIRAADFELERAFVDALSPATGYQRLMSTRTPSAEEIRRFTDIDYEREMALIATVALDGRECQVGVARYVKEGAGTAEFAIVLADDWQRRGLGAKLLASLVHVAADRGVRRLVATTHSANAGMLALARRLGFRATHHPGSATITTLALDL